MITTFLLAGLLQALPDLKVATDLSALPNAPAIELTAHTIPQKKSGGTMPVTAAHAALVMDPDSGTVLYAKNSDEKVAIASLTKLMTAVITVEEEPLDRIIKVSENATQVAGTKMWLKSGERIAVKDVLAGLLVASGNDAAMALAEANAGGMDQFVQKMNEKAALLGMYSTRFANPTGLDNPEAYSTASDLSLLTLYALRKPEILSIVDKPSLTIGEAEGGTIRHLENTNKLLGSSLFTIKGMKTGSTKLAGLCLITLAENKKGNRVVSIVLGSPARFKESKLLIDWAFRNYVW